MKKFLALALVSALFVGLLCGCGKTAATSTTAAASSAAASTAAASASAPAASASASASASAAAASTGKSASDINIAVVLHALNGSFYTKLKDGAEAAGKDLGVNVTVSAPNQASSLEEQVGLLETAIASGANAIATVTWDPTGFNSVISEADAAGIPVVGFNQDAAGCGTKCFIGQDYQTAGYKLGKYIFDKMGGQGTYIIASCAPTDTALVAREAGIDAAAAEYNGKITKIETIDIGTDLTNAYSVVENALLANPDVTAIIGVDVFSEAIGSVIEDYNKTGVVYAAGFDLTEGMLQHIKNGSVQVTCGQNPFLQGYYSVMSCYLNLAYGSDFLNIDTGAQLVDSTNVDSVQPE